MGRVELDLSSLEGDGHADELEETMDGPRGIPYSGSLFETFSIRNYVAGVRKVSIKKCWPFSPQFLETKLQKGVDNVLPPLEVLTYRYWGCQDCVGNAISQDDSNQEQNVHTPLEASESDPLITNVGNLSHGQHEKEKEYFSEDMGTSDMETMSCEILMKDESNQNVATHVAPDIKIEETPSTNNERIFHFREGETEDTSNVADKIGGAPSINNERTCHFREGDTEDISDVAERIGAAPSINNENICHIREGETEDTSNVVARDEVFQTIANYGPISGLHHETKDDMTTESEHHHIINDHSENTPFTSTSGCNHDVDRDDCPIQVSANGSNEEVIQKKKETEAKQQKENGKAQKKRSIADLIATAPPDQIREDDANNGASQNPVSENTPREARIGTWKQKHIRSQRVFKDAMHSFNKFKGKKKIVSDVHGTSILTNSAPEEVHLESFEIKRKRQRLGTAAQSSFSGKFKKKCQKLVTMVLQETKLWHSPLHKGSRKAEEGEIVTNGLKHTPIDDLSRGSRTKLQDQKFVLDKKQKTEACAETDDDLMDLAAFMAQKQLERFSSFPSSSLPKGKCHQKRRKPSHILKPKIEHLNGRNQDQSDVSSMDGLITKQDALRSNHHEFVSKNGHPCLAMEKGHRELNLVNDNLMSEEQSVSRQGHKKGTITAKRDGTVAVSKDCSSSMRTPCEKKRGHEGKFASFMMAQQSNKNYSSSRRKKSEACDLEKSKTQFKGKHGPIKTKKSDDKESFDHRGISSQLHLSGERRCQQITQSLDSFMQEKSSMSEQTKGTRTALDLQNNSDIVVRHGKRNSVHRGKLTNLAKRGKNNKKCCVSKRMKSATHKSSKKSNLCSKQDLAGEQNALRYITTEEVPNEVHLQGGECQQRNQVEVSHMAEILNASGQTTEARSNPIRDDVFPCSNDFLDNMRRAPVKSSGCRKKTLSFVAMKGAKIKGTSASQCEVIAASKSMKLSKSSSKGRSGRQVASQCISPKGIPEDGSMDPVIDGKQQINPEFLAPKKLNMPNQATAGGPMSNSKYGIASSLEHLSATIEKVDEDGMVPRKKLVSSAATKRRDKSSSTSKKKRSGDHKSVDGTNLSPNQDLRGKIAFRCNLAELGSEDGQAGAVGDKRDQNNQDQQCLAAENIVMVGAGVQTGTVSDSKERVVSRDCSDIATVTSDKNKVSKGKDASCVVTRRQKDKGSSSSHRKKLSGHKSNKELISLAKASGSRMSIIEETNAALHAAVSEWKGRSSGYSSERTLNPRKRFKLQETLGPPDVGPNFKDKELLTTNDDSLQLTLNSQGLVADSSKIHLESGSSKKRHNASSQRTNGLNSMTSNGSVCEPETGPQHPMENIFTDQTMHSIDRKFSMKNADAEMVVKNQDAFEDDNNLVQLNDKEVSNSFAEQLSSNAACLPVQGFLASNISQNVSNNSGSCNSFGRLLQYVTMASPAAESTCKLVQWSNYSPPLICSTGFSVTQGDDVNIPTNNNYDLNLYIQERIKFHRSSCDSGLYPKRNASTKMDSDAGKQPKPGKTIFKIKDVTSKQTLQSVYGEPGNTLKHQSFGSKPAILTRNITDIIKTETWDAESLEQRTTSMHENVRTALTLQPQTSPRPILQEYVELTSGCKHYLNMPAQNTKQHVPIHSTVPSIQESNFSGPPVKGGEFSGGASNKEGSVLTGLAKDPPLELSLSIKPESKIAKQCK